MIKDEHKELLSTIAIITNRNEDGCTIDELNNITGINKCIIENNLEKLSNNTEIYFEYQPYKEDGIWKVDKFNEELEGYYVVCLDKFEKGIFDMVINSPYNSLGVVIEKLYDSAYEEYIPLIGAAIYEKKVISVKYKNSKNEINEIKVFPLALVYYEFENKFFVLGQYDNMLTVYSLESFIELKITNINFEDNLNINFNEYLANIWGMELGKKVNVKIKFVKEANVEEKVKRDLQRRIHKTIEEYDDYFIYSDEIIGINSFKEWLRSFGSSAIVLEPEELKNEIINEAKELLKYYDY